MLLRQPVPDIDGPALDSWFGDDPDGVWNTFLARPGPDQRVVLQAEIESQDHRCWVIEVGQQQIGIVRLSTRDRPPRRAALLYYIAPAYRKRGHATAAVKIILRHAFDDLGIDAVLADVLRANTPSAGVLQRLGFDRVGRTLASTDIGPQQLEEWRLGRP